MINKKKVGSFIRNVLAIIFILGAFGGFAEGDYLAAIFAILFGLSLSTAFDALIKKTNFNASVGLRIIISVVLFFAIGFTSTQNTNAENPSIAQKDKTENKKPDKDKNSKEETESKPSKEDKTNQAASDTEVDQSQFEGYTFVDAASCSISGNRMANAVVDIGYGDREYWAFTNEHGQLVRVIAKEIILQDDAEAKSNGRYCNDEAKVPGTEDKNLDEGHVIADSLGGVSNAYNITPQNSTLNRHGDQAYMEKVIRQAGGCTDFEAIITYPNTETQIPSHYKYTYTLKGNVIVDEFDNVNPDDTVPQENTSNQPAPTPAPQPEPQPEPTPTPQPQPEPQGQMVWISATGSKYHSINNCGRMNPNTASHVTINEAINMGLEACSKCF